MVSTVIVCVLALVAVVANVVALVVNRSTRRIWEEGVESLSEDAVRRVAANVSEQFGAHGWQARRGSEVTHQEQDDLGGLPETASRQEWQ